MFNASVRLDRMVCNVDPEGSAEPYMWTSFFHADLITLASGPGHRIATYTPHANWTTRGVFPGGIGAGDSVNIPPSLGAYEVELNRGVPSSLPNIAVVGALFVLMEQDDTPGDAIRAGHEAFAEAVDRVLNNFVDDNSDHLDEDPPTVPEPTEAEIEMLASEIQGEVMGAIKDELSLIHLLFDHDDFYGFGYVFLTDLPDMVVGGVSTSRQFSSRIARQIDVGPINLSYDYEIELHVTSEPGEQTPDDCRPEYEVYSEAATEVRRIDLELQRITEELRSAPEDARVALKRDLRNLCTTRRPAALDLLDSAHQTYQLCRDVVFSPAAHQLSKNQMKAETVRPARSAHRPIPVKATVGTTKLL
jgi:hypothetical protein